MKESDSHHEDSFRDRISTVNASGKRNWVYALKPSGKWYKYRIVFAVLYLAFFILVPFIKVNGNPLMLINLVQGKFILFSKIFWPQDFFIFALGMITMIIFIVLFTVIYGRLFCGWVCPQTVFMEFIYRPIEWLIEGSPSQQRKLNDGPWTFEKIWKKTVKHLLYFLIAVLITHVFLAYIVGVDEIGKFYSEPLGDHIGLFSGILFFSLLFYGVFAFVRDIVCTTICPYGRLQGVMFDKDTMQIAYDYNRGEPRGKFRKNVERTEGDCINCLKCVQVCPTGIDIRNGLQMECVGCTACIDACNEIMDAMHFERGLIRYASETELKTGEKFHFNNRMKAYTALLMVLVIVMSAFVATRKSVDTYISRVKGQLYQETQDQKISNLFEAKIINKTKKEMPLSLKVQGFDGNFKFVGVDRIVLKKEAITDVTFFLEIPKDQVKLHSTPIKIEVYSGDEKLQSVKTKFLGPFN